MGMSPNSLLSFLEENCEIRNDGNCWNKKTQKIIKACLPMHTYGFPVRIDEIKKICQKYKINLIEDSAESLGSYYKNIHTGKFGKISSFSFNGNKIITSGGGGMIVTDDEAIAKEAKHLTSTAKTPHKWNFVHDRIGYNYRMPNLNAALGLAQIENLNYFIEKKEIIFLAYLDWSKRNDFKIIEQISDAKSNHWLNILIAEDVDERNKILTITHENNIFARPVWNLLHELPMYKSCYNYNLVNTAFLADRIICLPSSSNHE